jgi:hypothetical protein
MMRLFHLFIFTILAGSSLWAQTQIREIASIEQLLDLADPASSQLIILDIDNTLYHPRQMLGSDEWFDYFHKKQCSLHGNTPEARQHVVHLWRAIQTVTEVIPIEAQTALLVQSIQNKACCVMAMTTRGPEMANTTFQQTASLKIDLSRTSPTKVRFQIHKMPEVHYGNGILFTNGNPKGEVLKEFLHQIQWMPSQIIYVNDKKEPLDEVAASLPETVHFLGLRYSGADHFVQNFSPEIADIELEHFEHIFSDEDAANQLSEAA